MSICEKSNRHQNHQIWPSKRVLQKPLIIDNKADYLMGLKGNQSTLLDEIQYYFDDACAANFEGVDHDFYYYVEEGHGREEKRTIQVACNLEEWLPQIDDWRGLKTAIEVVSERTVKDKIETLVLDDLRKFGTPAKVRHSNKRKGRPSLKRMARTGIEPATQGFSVLCSTD
jgi:hypothetical protein